MRRATGTVVAGVMAVLCAAVLAGCQGQSVAAQPVGGVVTPASGSTASAPSAGSASSAASANGPAGAGVDSDLNAVDGQLAGLDSAMAQATQSPSDGG